MPLQHLEVTFLIFWPDYHHNIKQILDTLKDEFGQNFWAGFHKGSVRVCQSNSNRVTRRAASFPESLRDPSEHAGARRYKDQKLDVRSKWCWSWTSDPESNNEAEFHMEGFLIWYISSSFNAYLILTTTFESLSKGFPPRVPLLPWEYKLLCKSMLGPCASSTFP